MKRSGMTELDDLFFNPAATFAAPEDVLEHGRLTRTQKIRILKLWQHDAAEAEVATEEGMPGSSGGLLRRVLLTLHRVSGDAAAMRTDPSKHHTLM